MDEYMSEARVWGLTCPGSVEEVGRVRRWTRDVLRHSPYAGDAEVIVSELSSNAVLHTASGCRVGHFHVALCVSEHVIAISVADAGGSPTRPVIGHPQPTASSGRGLSLVCCLATRTTVRGDRRGHTVTAELVTTPTTMGEER
ncbi:MULTISPECIES: ATP-binding protein [Streptomyces]|uniref:ATP-binding protein n=1 Tax=Streptomyces TaxID=1883 RepID=UPI00163BDD60|nr:MULTISPECIES: ATP-binding protein [Streptomyces]MBC2876005.1 ATP-binding protein [Streptomyces sp. TYQ1024]UBI38371.1 ATP-binding protein [Streptomyces mobaraensis]UKW30955.1 ATP-binding protein [Streptomyces sp. TYQ1024]